MINNIPIRINALQHIGIPVTNIDRSKDFYLQLGFRSVMEAPFYIDQEKGTCIMMEQAGMLIELYQLPNSQLPEISTRKNGRIDHIAFDVTDIELSFKTAQEFGLQPHQEAPVFLDFWDKGCKYFTINGPDGEVLEFNERIK